MRYSITLLIAGLIRVGGSGCGRDINSQQRQGDHPDLWPRQRSRDTMILISEIGCLCGKPPSLGLGPVSYHLRNSCFDS
ncbi:hypothetical protein P389DRAFT_47103 [Cystobasidium minutum MCA 4210]|uniref:uncharacterized protein n=1 Tax=Cystobasidium minutum MCA 4210 TaxID=1397322 RepID=UPI0034CFB598|eukprot:jgi/Rhomi1/47103/CE47102_89